MKRDLVCLMTVDEREVDFHYDYQGKTYYFCAKECEEKFSKYPNEYLVRHGELLDSNMPDS